MSSPFLITLLNALLFLLLFSLIILIVVVDSQPCDEYCKQTLLISKIDNAFHINIPMGNCNNELPFLPELPELSAISAGYL